MGNGISQLQQPQCSIGPHLLTTPIPLKDERQNWPQHNLNLERKDKQYIAKHFAGTSVFIVYSCISSTHSPLLSLSRSLI